MTTANAVQCMLCPRYCFLKEGDRGDCRVRINLFGKLQTLVYDKPCAIHVDPIEKKPLFHMLPGSRSFSLATAGCNLHCKFCQNWEISQREPEETANYDLSPEKIVALAQREKCASIAYTYSDPVIFYEYTYDTSKLAHEHGIKNVLVTAGYINEKPLRELCKVVDAANVDLKGFTENYYKDVCFAKLQPVLDAIKVMVDEGILVELTTLIVPTLNDDMTDIKNMCLWIKDELGDDIPHHFSRFHPMYKLRNLPPTPLETLLAARDTAKDAGLKYVYIGNVPGYEGENTACPHCSKVLVRRKGYIVLENNITQEGKCSFCSKEIPGIWK